MSAQFHAFGEMLWDCLPSGRHAGGAPFNVTAHLAQLGVTSALISAVGRDALGDEILAMAAQKRVDTTFVTRAGLETGQVIGAVDARGNATYEIVQPAAWDEIIVSDEAFASVAQSRALVFGSLAGRSAHNARQLDRLLAIAGPLKCFDVNLRQPFVDPARIFELAARADLVKLNDDEIGQLVSWTRTGRLTPVGPTEVAEACAAFADVCHVSRICVTMGAAGALLWEVDAAPVHVPAPPTEVKDTVGAGDAFLAVLVIGLTRGVDPRTVLECACRLGAFVASQAGATPLLPAEMIEEINGRLSSST